MIFRLTPDLKEVVQQGTMKEPNINDYMFMVNGMFGQIPDVAPAYFDELRAYDEHIKSLPRFPARGFTEKHLGVDLKEGEEFKFEITHHIENEIETLSSVAVPIAAGKEELTVKVHRGGDDYTNGVFDYIVALNQRIDVKELEKMLASSTESDKGREIERRDKIIERLFDCLGEKTYSWSAFRKDNNL